MAISSTDCRARVAPGEPVWYLVPDGVVQYIAKRQPLPALSASVSAGSVRNRPELHDRDAAGYETLGGSHARSKGERCQLPNAPSSWRSRPPRPPPTRRRRTSSIIDVGRPARHHRRVRARLRAQRASGAGHRRRHRGAPAGAAGEGQAGAPRGRAGWPLGAARLRRHRGARPAHRGARVLRARPALEGLPARSRSSTATWSRPTPAGPPPPNDPADRLAARQHRLERRRPRPGADRRTPQRARPRPGPRRRAAARRAAARRHRRQRPAPRRATPPPRSPR